MILRGTDFGPVCGASGVQGFWGEGYPIHRVLRILFPGRFSFQGMTLTAKTVTLYRNLGNMPLKGDGTTPKERIPRCVVVNFRKGYMLNSVGLSNFGARFYLDSDHWQEHDGPVILSFMCLGKTRQERVSEIEDFVSLLLMYIRYSKFQGKVALQINFSCPNVGHELDELVKEVEEMLCIASALGIPLIPKFNILLDPERAAEIARHRFCDAICVSNTIPWGHLPEFIDWKGLFGSTASPLEARGFLKGGLSGAPITDIVRRWVSSYSVLNAGKPLCAGGGIMTPADAVNLMEFPCVKQIFVGSVASLRPWRLQPIIRTAHERLRPRPSITFANTEKQRLERKLRNEK